MPRDSDFKTNSPRLDTTPHQIPTAAEALRLVDDWIDLTEKRRMELRAALRLLGRVYGVPLEAINLNPVELGPKFLSASAASVGIKPSSLAAYRSTVRSILRRLGLIDLPRRQADALTPAWASLRAALPDQFISIRLQDFIGFCSQAEIAPDAVNEQTLLSYFEYLRTRRLRGAPCEHLRRVVKAWARAQRQVAGWPTAELLGPNLSKQYALPLTAYPASFQEDAAAFERQMRLDNGAELFDITGPASALSDDTIRLRLNGVRYAAAALVETGTAPSAIDSLAVLVEHGNIRRAIDWHWKRADKIVTDHVGSIAATLRVIAKYHVKLPDAALAEALQILRRATPAKRSRMEPKRERRLQHLDDPDVEARLLHLPRRIMVEATQLMEVGQRVEAGWLAGVAVAIAIELRCPMRIKNLAALRLGVELVKLDSRSKVFTHILVAGADVKNGVALNRPVNTDLAKLIDDYVTKFRVHLPHSQASFLFPNRDHADRPRQSAGLGRAISEVIDRLVGIKLTPHDFRAIAGREVLMDNPHAMNDLRLLLGHKSQSTTRAYYASFQPKQAAARYNALIDRKLGDSKLLAKASFAKTAPSRTRRGATPRGTTR